MRTVGNGDEDRMAVLTRMCGTLPCFRGYML